MHLRSLASDSGWQRVGMDLVIPDATDTLAPDTSLLDAPALVPAGTAAFAVTGNDDDTPPGLLRFRAWLDGAPLFDGEASALPTVRADITDGPHVLEVAAVDLNGNEDASPVTHNFIADGNLPRLRVIERPMSIHSALSVTAEWTGEDDEGPVQSRWELRVLNDDGTTTVVQEAPFAAETTSLEAGGLTPAALYELEIVVRDQAGNVSSETIGFAVDPNLAGCSVRPQRSSPSPLFAIVALLTGLALLRRR